MDEIKCTQILAAVDECIEQVITERRGQVKKFVTEVASSGINPV